LEVAKAARNQDFDVDMPAGALTVSAIKPALGSATIAGPSGSYSRYS
jgi:hypothetical protein